MSIHFQITETKDIPIYYETDRPVTARNVQYPNLVDISRIPDQFFPNQQSCLDSALVDQTTAQWINGQTKTVKDIRTLLSNTDYAKKLLEEIKGKARELAGRQIPDYSKKNPINHTSLVVYPERKYVLTFLPKLDELQGFWKNIIDLNSQNIVAAMMPQEETEEADHSLEYCNESHYPLQIDRKRTVYLEGKESLAKSRSIPNCEVVKRTFVVRSDNNAIIIHHYHYQGWKNKKGAPDSELLSKLICELSKNEAQESPLTVHCACGRGRSGNVVLAEIFRQRIIASKLENGSLENATLNIAEILMQGRLQRDGFVESPEQITSAFESALIGL
jgi:protein tyrosine phosphatase